MGLDAGALSLIKKKPVVPGAPLPYTDLTPAWTPPPTIGTPVPVAQKPVAIPGFAPTPTATSGGGANLAPLAPIAPKTDIRGSVVTAPVSPLQTQASGQLANALQQFQGGVANLPAYKPVAGPNYSQAQNYLSQAGQTTGQATLTPQGSIAPTNVAPTQSALALALQQAQSPEATQLRAMGMTSLGGLSSSPDRLSLAAQALQLQREMTQPAWEQDLRTVGQKAAAYGRLGSGMTTSELGDVTLQREKALGQYGQQAALEAAGQTLADRLNIFGATTGYGNQVAGQDLARAGFGQNNALAGFDVANAVRGQGVDERNFQSDQSRAAAALALQRAGLQSNLAGQSADLASNTANFGASQQAAAQDAAFRRAALQQALVGSLSDVQGQQFNQGIQTAGLRTQQQGFQAQQAQQAIENAKQQQLLQEQLMQGAFGRQFDTARLAASTGYGNDPYSLQLQGSQYTQGQATDQAAASAQLAQQMALQQYLRSQGLVQ
jgi:hypothetical protein